MELSFIQSIALNWYRVIDANGLSFTLLKNLNKVIRFIFYFALFISVYIALQICASFINIESLTVFLKDADWLI